MKGEDLTKIIESTINENGDNVPEIEESPKNKKKSMTGILTAKKLIQKQPKGKLTLAANKKIKDSKKTKLNKCLTD